MRRTRSPWFKRTSSANNVATSSYSPTNKTSGLISASQSVLRLHRKGNKDNNNKEDEPVARKNTNKKFTVPSSKSHLGFLPDSNRNNNINTDSSTSTLRFKRKKGHVQQVSDRGQALPLATFYDEDNITAAPRGGEFASSGMLTLRRNNNGGRPPVPKTTVPGLDPGESENSGTLVVRSRSKPIYLTKRKTRKAIAASQKGHEDPTQDSGSQGVLEMRLKRRREALKANLDAKASIDPTDEADNSRRLLEMRRKRLRETEDLKYGKDEKRKNSKKDLKASMDPTNESCHSRSLLELRRTRLREAEEKDGKRSNSSKKEDIKASIDPTNELDTSRSRLELRRNKVRAADEKDYKRKNSKKELKTSTDPTKECDIDNSRAIVEMRRNKVRAADEKDGKRKSKFNVNNEQNATMDQHTNQYGARPKHNHNSCGELTRKQQPTPIPGGNNNSTRTESASSANEITGPVVKILRGRKDRSAFSADRTQSGPISHSHSESTSASRSSSRTRSGPIASSKPRSEFESQRELRLQLHHNKGNVAGGAKSNYSNKANGSDSSTSDDEPTSTPRNAKVASSAVPSSVPSPPVVDTKDQSRAESMPHLRRRKYIENTPPDSDRPRVCPVIPGLSTTKSFRNSSSQDPDAPPAATLSNTTNISGSSNQANTTSQSMASLQRRKNGKENKNHGHGHRNFSNSQFEADRAGDTPIIPSVPSTAPKSAFPGNGNHGGSSSMLRLRRLRYRKNEPDVESSNMRSETDQTLISPPSRYGFPSSKSASRINHDPTHNEHQSHSMLRLRRTKRLHLDANPAMINTADAAPPPPLRYSHADLRISGWLSKKGKRLGTKVERFFTLRGCVLSNARSKGAKPSSSINVRGAKVYGGAHREIIIALPKAVVSFFAPSSDSHTRWIKALQAVSSCVFDFYDKGKRIGKGAYSEVFLGRDRIRNELCAIKVLQRPDADHGKLIDREVNLLHLLNHSNIVQIYDIFETTKTTYIVMEFLPGGELLDMITENDNLSELCAKHVISQLLRAISYLHMKDIVHRDIKPDNILCVGRTWPLHVKLTDFGLSQIVNPQDGGVMKSQCGTAFYLAPEIARNLDYGKPVDLWACGIVLYVMLAGKFPFYGDNHKEFIRRLRNGVKFPSKQWRNISPDAKDLILCLLDSNPNSRLTADQALQHRWLVNDPEPKSTFGGPAPRNLQSEFTNDLQSMPAVNLSRRGYRDKSNRSSGLTARATVESIQDLPSFTTSVSTVGDPQSESMVF